MARKSNNLACVPCLIHNFWSTSKEESGMCPVLCRVLGWQQRSGSLLPLLLPLPLPLLLPLRRENDSLATSDAISPRAAGACVIEGLMREQEAGFLLPSRQLARPQPAASAPAHALPRAEALLRPLPPEGC